MSKTNKELAVDICLELIKANQRLVIPNAQGVGTAKPSMSLENVNSVIKSVHSTLEGLDNTATKN